MQSVHYSKSISWKSIQQRATLHPKTSCISSLLLHISSVATWSSVALSVERERNWGRRKIWCTAVFLTPHLHEWSSFDVQSQWKQCVCFHCLWVQVSSWLKKFDVQSWWKQCMCSNWLWIKTNFDTYFFATHHVHVWRTLIREWAFTSFDFILVGCLAAN